MTRDWDVHFLNLAYEQALKSYVFTDSEGVRRIPIGAVLVEDGAVVGKGHNQRIQLNDPIAHGEMDCIRSAGRRPHGYGGTTVYTTLSPCMMCSGTIVQFGIPRVVVADGENFAGNIAILESHGVLVDTTKPHEACIRLMAGWIRDYPHVWNEDIAGRDAV